MSAEHDSFQRTLAILAVKYDSLADSRDLLQQIVSVLQRDHPEIFDECARKSVREHLITVATRRLTGEEPPCEPPSES